MYLNPSYTIQFPEITEAIKDYYANVYDHDNLINNRFKIQDRFIEDFVPWINQGHMCISQMACLKQSLCVC